MKKVLPDLEAARHICFKVETPRGAELFVLESLCSGLEGLRLPFQVWRTSAVEPVSASALPVPPDAAVRHRLARRSAAGRRRRENTSAHLPFRPFQALVGVGWPVRSRLARIQRDVPQMAAGSAPIEVLRLAGL